MKCINCKTNNSKVTNTIIDEETGIIYRRRKCNNCKFTFYTKEVTLEEAEINFKQIYNKRQRKEKK